MTHNVIEAHSVDEFLTNTHESIDRLQKSGQPEILTVNGQSTLVVQSAVAYQQILERIEELETIEAIQASLNDPDPGRPAEEVFQKLAKKHSVALPPLE